MAETGNQSEKGTANIEERGAHPLRRIVAFALSLLLLLALLSVDVRDSDQLAGGVTGTVVIHNWIGYIGAWVSRFLLLLFGFGAYILVIMLFTAAARRLFGRRGFRSLAWDYWGAFLLTAFGGAMLFGIWPDFAAELTAKLNLETLPGGIIGQRFCAPGDGWMQIILNPTGSAIVALALVAVGLSVIWIRDWHEMVKLHLHDRAEVQEKEPERKVRRQKNGESLKERLTRRREERAARRQAQLLNQENRKEKSPDTGKALSQTGTLPLQDSKNVATTTKSKAGGNAKQQMEEYRLPSLDLLNGDINEETTADPKEVEAKREILQNTLDSFGIDAEVGDTTSGPRVTLFEVLPAPGVKVEKISRISNNIAMELRAVSLRILTPIPGKKSVGIEVPNASAAMVSLHSLMSSSAWKRNKYKLPLLLGRSISGNEVILDLARAPHLLIAGATGSGKSVCINVLIMSLLYKFSPEELRLIMIDPKVVEFRAYEALPHLVVPVISDVKKVPLALRWVINEMERRYKVLAKVNARNLEGFNARPKSRNVEMDDDGNPIPAALPYIVVIIDELADIMMTAKADVETSLARIAQLSRAVGIHTVIATQRPSVNVITGTIKANYPTRIAFQVTSQIDSRTILDGKGAEALLGRGDMLFRPPGASKLERNQGALVEDEELERVVAYVAEQRPQDFDEGVFRSTDAASDDEGAPVSQLTEEDEQLLQTAIDIIVRDRRATTSYLQRCMRIGYNRAASLIEALEQRGVIGPQIGTAPREILIVGKHDGDADDDDNDAFADDEQGDDE